MKRLKGKLTISRPRGGSVRDEDGCVNIALRDESSYVSAVEIEIPLMQFAECLFSLGDVPCEFEFNDSGVVGKTRENKTVEVLVPKHDYGDKKTVRKAVAKHECDGWEGRDDDATNGHKIIKHNADGSGVYRVVYIRFVDSCSKSQT